MESNALDIATINKKKWLDIKVNFNKKDFDGGENIQKCDRVRYALYVEPGEEGRKLGQIEYIVG